MASTTVTLRLLVDPKSKRVLFGEADKDFVDFLFNILLLPVASAIPLLATKGMVGCLGNLYLSIENLDDHYMKRTANKDTLLKPMVNPLMAMSPEQQCFYSSTNSAGCANTLYGEKCRYYVANDSRSTCPTCGGVMNRKAIFVNPPKLKQASPLSSGKRGYVKGVAKFMIMDDLVVKPMSSISSVIMLKEFNVQDVGALQEKVINVGMSEAVRLLKRSLQSETVLTDLFFNEGWS